MVLLLVGQSTANGYAHEMLCGWMVGRRETGLNRLGQMVAMMFSVVVKFPRQMMCDHGSGLKNMSVTSQHVSFGFESLDAFFQGQYLIMHGAQRHLIYAARPLFALVQQQVIIILLFLLLDTFFVRVKSFQHFLSTPQGKFHRLFAQLHMGIDGSEDASLQGCRSTVVVTFSLLKDPLPRPRITTAKFQNVGEILIHQGFESFGF
mmetsp:Transcript_32772/g.68344  ORF Transcript_32772/g.68344 Transcript_32772/m.68344 type:complete len:205 (-) Transcript_32772:510-1124(-)